MKILKWMAIVVASLIVLPLLTLLILSHRAGAGTTHTSIELAASPERVWVWLDEGPRLKQWVSWLVEVRDPDAPNHHAGSPVTWVMKDENNGGMMMTLDARIAEYAPPSRLTIAINSPVYQFDGAMSYRLTPLGNGRTRLDTDGLFHYNQWFAALMEPLVTPSAKKKMVADQARLKGLVETSAEVR
ncbi:MAG TPA: SRPBCC family protein [Candidatus Sulfopaludibacter sp.]|jgi:uncharacterized protein YndB with AHSA1/START domain|nr:SRPBCC family protein [Candidatus Sulfopaludibacter sp.]